MNSRLELVSILGEGAFGEVWKAMLKPDKAEIKAEDDVEVQNCYLHLQ